jgi:hypothetical protein
MVGDRDRGPRQAACIRHNGDGIGRAGGKQFGGTGSRQIHGQNLIAAPNL